MCLPPLFCILYTTWDLHTRVYAGGVGNRSALDLFGPSQVSAETTYLTKRSRTGKRVAQRQDTTTVHKDDIVESGPVYDGKYPRAQFTEKGM